MQTILLVDDEDIVRQTLVLLLQGRGYAVMPAASGEEAVQLWSKHQDQIGLLLSDMCMPGLTGLAVANLCRIDRPTLPVILMSGYHGTGASHLCYLPAEAICISDARCHCL